MEFISAAGKKIEGAYVSGNVLVIRMSDGRCIYAEAKVNEVGKPLLEVFLNK
ncbi:hypothetical protein M5X17_31110 [Paenibacillus alvei]|uniref:hypothetical protein n=1 Tax=Paenibacillus alvei TaxID=44250 RepID=UPI00227E2ECE|nr:hypothetical protein [Paenibacillus alvei]MCY9738143.1 hypothetical protein [Paenibacillus alvei]